MGESCSKGYITEGLGTNDNTKIEQEEERIKRVGPQSYKRVSDVDIQQKLDNIQDKNIKQIKDNQFYHENKKWFQQNHQSINEEEQIFPLPYLKLLDTSNIYKGQWQNHKFHGWGELFFDNGSHFQGKFEKGSICKGNMIYHNGDYFIGYFQNNLAEYGNWNTKQGGDMKIKSGNFKKENEFTYNIGECLEINNVIKYEGEFQNNQFHGKGILTYLDGTERKYDGQFQNNQKNGKNCTFEWPLQQAKYTGGYQNDKKEGYGEMQFLPGIIYKGNFKDGKMDGKGILEILETKIEVFFEQGKLINQQEEIDEVIQMLFDMDQYNEEYQEYQE